MRVNQTKSVILQELEILEEFLREQPQETIREAANYILERIRLNISKLQNTNEEHLAPRFKAVLTTISQAGGGGGGGNVFWGKLKTLPFCEAQREIQAFIKNRHGFYSCDEETAKNLADNWNGKVQKPQNIRFIENAVPVVLCANDNWAPYLAVMLQSLLDKSNPNRKYHFIIFERGFSCETKNYLESQILKFPHCAIDFIDISSVFNEIPLVSPSNNYSVDMFSRLFIPYWLDKYPKVIYCDCDMLAKADIAELYDLDICHFSVAAVIDKVFQTAIENKEYGSFLLPVFMLLEDWSRYINSGLLVFDTKKFKENYPYQDLFRFAIYYANRYTNTYGDQDILNILIKDNYFVLPPEWNSIWYYSGLHYPTETNAKIIHFITDIKPWKNHPAIENNPDAIAYRNYAKSVPLYNENLIYQELTNLESFLKEQSFHEIIRQAYQIIEKTRLNCEKFDLTKIDVYQNNLLSRYSEILRIVMNYLKIYLICPWGGGVTSASHYTAACFYNQDENVEKIKRIIGVLADEQSKKEFLGLIEFRKTLNQEDFPVCAELEIDYFIKEMKLNKNEVFIDCGAFIGDTIDDFLNCSPGYEQIIAFEPDTRNFKKLKEKHENNDKITFINAGVYDKDGEVLFSSFENSGSASKISGVNSFGPDASDMVSIQVKSIDNLNLKKTTFIKMDIEGAELNALKGAEKTILRDKPKLAISIYHSKQDMLRIAEYINDLVPEYKIYIRHHRPYPYMIETVLYALMPDDVA